jgi:DNA-binding IclR family transcriptional regulator
VFNALRERPMATIPDLARRTGLTYSTTSTMVGKLAELGIVREVTGRRRDRVFAYDQYVQILSEGTEPL